MGKPTGTPKNSPPPPRIEAILFDLDGTLYSIENGYEDHVRERIKLFMVESLGVETMQLAGEIWSVCFKTYNQSLRGLRAAGYRINETQYWEFIRNGTTSFLKPEPGVRALLESLPQRKWVFTNCREKEAQDAIEAMGLGGLFAGIVGADSMGTRCKPDEEVFRRAFARAGVDPRYTCMFEDSVKNLETAKKLGLYTVLVDGKTRHEEGKPLSCVDAIVADCTLDAVKAAIPHLWST